MLTLAEIHTITATDRELFKKRRASNQTAYAFGRSQAYNSFSYVGLDAVAVVLTNTLAQSYDLSTAAHLVRLDCDRWSQAVAYSEEYPDRPSQYCIIDAMRAGKLEHLSCFTNSTDTDEIAHQLSMSPQALGAEMVRLSCVNVAPLIAVIRKLAEKHGIDIGERLLPPLNSEAFKTLFAPYVAARDAAVDIVGKRKSAKDKRSPTLEAGRRARELFEAQVEGHA